MSDHNPNNNDKSSTSTAAGAGGLFQGLHVAQSHSITAETDQQEQQEDLQVVETPVVSNRQAERQRHPSPHELQHLTMPLNVSDDNGGDDNGDDNSNHQNNSNNNANDKDDNLLGSIPQSTAAEKEQPQPAEENTTTTEAKQPEPTTTATTTTTATSMFSSWFGSSSSTPAPAPAAVTITTTATAPDAKVAAKLQASGAAIETTTATKPAAEQVPVPVDNTTNNNNNNHQDAAVQALQAAEQALEDTDDDLMQDFVGATASSNNQSTPEEETEEEDDTDVNTNEQALRQALERPSNKHNDSNASTKDDEEFAGPPTEVVVRGRPDRQASAMTSDGALVESASGTSLSSTAGEEVAAMNADTGNTNETNTANDATTNPLERKELNAHDTQVLDEAFDTKAAVTSPRTGNVAPTHGQSNSKDDANNNNNSTTKTNPPSLPRVPPRGTSTTELPPLPRLRGLGQVHPDTPVPNADVCLRLLRKFARKTRPRILTSYGGTKPLGLYGYLFGGKEDPTYVPYRLLMEILFEGHDVTSGEPVEGEDEMLQDDSEAENIVQGIMGTSGDTMDRAKRAMAAFCFVFSSWGHASSHLVERKDIKTRESFSDLLAAVFNAASTLVAHGCLDGVVMIVGDGETDAMPVTNLLTQSVLAADLNPARNELAAMKFLLSAGCRVTNVKSSSQSHNNAMLGGSHLLQTIRMLYHIFLTTESTPNKVTARAALQQLVTHVFAVMVQADQQELNAEQTPATTTTTTTTSDGFPSDHHRNAFLVLRAVCKLSMRNVPDAATGMHSHIGFASSGSHETWDGVQHGGGGGGDATNGTPPEYYGTTGLDSSLDVTNREHAQLIYTSAIHPALESKILALDLIHYVLTHTQFPPGFIHRSGPQFHAAIRNYLCVSLLKNCTSAETHVVNLSLRIFVPLMRNFRVILKNEIEAFVTNVFFVILDSKNSSADHKGIVVRTFDEICSDPSTLAEIFLNYDCDLSAVDLFHRIVNTLSRVSRTGLQDSKSSSTSLFGGASAARMEKSRFETRELRLDAMKALRQVLASLHASIVEPMSATGERTSNNDVLSEDGSSSLPSTPQGPGSAAIAYTESDSSFSSPSNTGVQNPVQVYGSKKKRRAEEAEAILRFNQKPSAGISFAAKCGHIDGEVPADVARYLLNHKDVLDKTMIGEYLGREAEYQNGFSIRVLHEYVRLMDFTKLEFDDAIRYFLSGFRLPGEAQKIDRIMEKFAERFTEQNPAVFPTADVAFILSFSIIMLNTDLHNPAIKEERRMTKEGFLRNNRGIADGQDLPPELLQSIFDRIRENPISLKEDDDAREREGSKNATKGSIAAAISPASFFGSHYEEMDRARENNFRKERDHIVRTTESLLKRRRHSQHESASSSPANKNTPTKKPSKIKSSSSQRFVLTEDSGLRDEYVAPMFDVAWGPALAAFSTAMESANGTVGSLLAIATDEELEIAAENAAETIEVCLTGFRFAICTGGLCGNEIARDSYMLALSRFSQLGSGVLLEPRHVRCIQTLLSVAREDGELIGSAWQYVFKALSEVNRFHQLFHLMARNDRAAAAAAERRRKRLEERENRKKAREERKNQAEENDSLPETDDNSSIDGASEVGSLAESDIFLSDDDMNLEEDMDAKAIDEANARLVYEGVSEDVIEIIYERSSTLSTSSISTFVSQLCYVSSMEISVGYGSATDLNHVSYRQKHAMLQNSSHGGKDQFHHSQPNIYNLQKLVEVAHWNMNARPRLIFADLWSTIGDHLTQTALHKNPALAMYAVDSFRQLSIQFLQREELEVFEFQRRFLKPLETVMAQSKQSSTKELLLNCVGRIVHVFDPANFTKTKGGLRSGWTPLLVILGVGCQDDDFEIAKLSNNILLGQIRQSTKPQVSSVLLTEHFSETLDALFMSINGPHSALSIKAVEGCAMLASYLGDETVETPHLRQRAGSSGEIRLDVQDQDLELWWPLLLGLSRATGDDRVDFRLKALDTLFGIINDNFFPAAANDVEKDDCIQRLQLVFRGILIPMLEYAEVGQPGRSLRVPKDFERFRTTRVKFASDGSEPTGWLDTMFHVFMDITVALAKRTMEVYSSDAMFEEVFAIFNHCLVSDSGALAVLGIFRLEQFVTSDLDQSLVTDDVWATFCHMLRRCLSVRNLPRKPPSAASNGSDANAPVPDEDEEEYKMEVREFIAEERALTDRKYVGSNAVVTLGNMLSSERICKDMGFRWRIFLIAGLGKGILAWEEAACLLVDQEDGPRIGNEAPQPPDYLETAQYGRQWMNRFIIQLASMEEVATAPDDSSNVYKNAQNLVMDETTKLLLEFVQKEKTLSAFGTEKAATTHARFFKLAKELIKGFTNMRHSHIYKMPWLGHVLVSACLPSKNEEILSGVKKFISMTKTPPAPESAASTDSLKPAAVEEDAAPHDESPEKAAIEGEAPPESDVPTLAQEEGDTTIPVEPASPPLMESPSDEFTIDEAPSLDQPPSLAMDDAERPSLATPREQDDDEPPQDKPQPLSADI